MKYRPPLNGDITDESRAYVNGSRMRGVPGSIPDARSFYDIQQEILNAIKLAGIDPEHEDLEQLAKAVRRLAGVEGGKVAQTFLGMMKVSSADVGAGFLAEKLRAGVTLDADIVNPAGEEVLVLDVADRAVTAAKLANNAVGLDQIAHGKAGRFIGFDDGGAPALLEVEGVPPGTIVSFAGARVPAGWLYCDGAYISQSAYADLYVALGAHYGVSGSDFRLPDLRHEFVRGTSSLSSDLGVKQGQSIQSHRHELQDDDGNEHFALSDANLGSSAGSDAVQYQGPNETGADTGISHTSYYGSSETRPRNMALNYIIKY